MTWRSRRIQEIEGERRGTKREGRGNKGGKVGGVQ